MIILQGYGEHGRLQFDKEKNAENVLVIKSKDLAKIYLDNWMKHKEHSEEYD